MIPIISIFLNVHGAVFRDFRFVWKKEEVEEQGDGR